MMEIYQYVIVFAVVFFLVLLLLFIYTQYSISRKQITIINSEGNEVAVDAEIADDPAKRARGLMFRDSLGENEGMLFVFPSEEKYGFWMVNTTIPLDAVYMDGSGNVVDVIAMEPCKNLNPLNCTVYRPKSEAKYVLEVNRGFSSANRIEKGSSRMIIE